MGVGGVWWVCVLEFPKHFTQQLKLDSVHHVIKRLFFRCFLEKEQLADSQFSIFDEM